MEAPLSPSSGPDPAGGGAVPVGPSGGDARPSGGDGPPPPTGRSLLTDIAIGAVVIAVIAAAIWGVPALTGGSASPTPAASGVPTQPSEVAAASASAVASATASSAASPGASVALPGPTQLPGGPFATSGAMAVLGADGSLTLVAADGRATPLAPADDNAVTFPAWSPDGTRIAAIRLGGAGSSEIVVFDARQAASGALQPTVILRSSSIGPFYLSWSPDGRTVSYLAEEPAGLSLRLAPADGSAPIDGSGPASRVRSGNPFYFDWIGSDRLLAHVGTGTDAILGEMSLDGSAAAPALTMPGAFRSPVVSADKAWISYVRAAAAGGGADSVVTTKRDGSGERTMPVFGMASVAFSPTAPIVASIGPTEATPTAFSIPVGPLRVLDATTGKARTLLDGTVLSDWWSPDGKTIAAIVVQPAGSGGVAAPGGSAPAPAASPAPSASAAPQEVRVVFVDAASGAIRSDAVIEPGRLFIDQYMTYFDQYSTSHQLWAPDSSSILIPIDDASGSHLSLVPRGGGAPQQLDGVMGTWSP